MANWTKTPEPRPVETAEPEAVRIEWRPGSDTADVFVMSHDGKTTRGNTVLVTLTVDEQTSLGSLSKVLYERALTMLGFAETQ